MLWAVQPACEQRRSVSELESYHGMKGATQAEVRPWLLELSRRLSARRLSRRRARAIARAGLRPERRGPLPGRPWHSGRSGARVRQQAADAPWMPTPGALGGMAPRGAHGLLTQHVRATAADARRTRGRAPRRDSAGKGGGRADSSLAPPRHAAGGRSVRGAWSRGSRPRRARPRAPCPAARCCRGPPGGRAVGRPACGKRYHRAPSDALLLGHPLNAGAHLPAARGEVTRRAGGGRAGTGGAVARAQRASRRRPGARPLQPPAAPPINQK